MMALPYRISSAFVTQSEVELTPNTRVEELPEYITYDQIQQQLDEVKAYVEKLSMKEALTPADVIDIEKRYPGTLSNQTNFALESFTDSSTNTLNVALEAFDFKIATLIAAAIAAVIAILWRVIKWIKDWIFKSNKKDDDKVDKPARDTSNPIECRPDLFNGLLATDAEHAFDQVGFQGAKVKDLASKISANNGHIDYILLASLVPLDKLSGLNSNLMLDSRYAKNLDSIGVAIANRDFVNYVSELNRHLTVVGNHTGNLENTFMDAHKTWKNGINTAGEDFLKVIDKQPLMLDAAIVAGHVLNLYKVALPDSKVEVKTMDIALSGLMSDAKDLFAKTQSTMCVEQGFMTADANRNLERADQLFSLASSSIRKDMKDTIDELSVTAKRLEEVRKNIKAQLEGAGAKLDAIDNYKPDLDNELPSAHNGFGLTKPGRVIISTYNTTIKNLVSQVSAFVTLASAINTQVLTARNTKAKLLHVSDSLHKLSKKGGTSNVT